MNIRCPTIEVNRDGVKVIMNLCDFDVETMLKWKDEILKSRTIPPLEVPPPPAFADHHHEKKVD